MLPQMTAEKRNNIAWAKCRMIGAETQPSYQQAMIFQFSKQNLDAMKEHWAKVAANPESVMQKFSGATEAEVV